jgi:hypothetical protein
MEGSANGVKSWEKFEERVKEWMSPQDLTFPDTGTENSYRERVQMLVDVIRLKKPRRLPIVPWIGFFLIHYGGITNEEVMNDYGKLGDACRKFYNDFDLDAYGGGAIYGSAKLFDILDYKLYRWPGHGVAATAPYQCVEAEYMQADEYDQFISDPSGFFMRRYLPRVFGSLGGWSMLPSLTDILELPSVGYAMVPVGLPAVQESFRAYLEAGRAALEWIETTSRNDKAVMTSLGIPAFQGGMTKAPFDTIGDTMRGTRGVMLDMFRRPAKLLEALDRIVPIAIELGVRAAGMTKRPVIFMPLHKGADGFMSNEGFRKFYWPSLKAVILGLVREGVVPFLFVEGSYSQRLDIVADPDIPAGSTIWMFDRTDLREVKKRFQGWACFGGNVPASLLATGTPGAVRDYVKALIDDVAGDGGFILSTGSVLDDVKPENFRAFVETGREFGVYR